mgnify:CR=1 FL=1
MGSCYFLQGTLIMHREYPYYRTIPTGAFVGSGSLSNHK